MADMQVDKEGDRLVITLDPGQPIELSDLSSSFAALARMYERHYRKPGDDDAPRLYVTRLETGSVVMEIAPCGIMMGGLALMDGGLIVTDFTARVWRTITHFSGRKTDTKSLEVPPKEDAADIKEFTKPLIGKNGANLGIKHARFEKGSGDKKTVIEYKFDEGELNRAAINIDKTLQLPPPTPDIEGPDGDKIHSEKILFLEQANRGPGKEKGRTGDRGRVPDISDKVVPVYFRKGVRQLKEQMMQGDENPFERAYIVDVHATLMDGDLKAYTVVEIHDSFERDD